MSLRLNQIAEALLFGKVQEGFRGAYYSFSSP